MPLVFTLLVLYQVKHFVCDYPLQGKYMLGKFKQFPGFIMPLLAHSAVHGVATYAIATYFLAKWPIVSLANGLAIKLALLDMSVHFVVDLIKANPALLGRFKPLSPSQYKMSELMSHGLSIASGEPMPPTVDPKTLQSYMDMGKKDIRGNKLFWWALGLDQMAHHLTHYFIIWMLL